MQCFTFIVDVIGRASTDANKLLNNSVIVIHVCLSNGPAGASANLTRNRVIMSRGGDLCTYIGGFSGVRRSLGYHFQVASRGKGGVFQHEGEQVKWGR